MKIPATTPEAKTSPQVPGLAASPSPSRKWLGLLSRRERWGLSWRGWCALGLAVVACSVLFIFSIYPFLAVTDQQPPSDYLLVEGWVPVEILRQSYTEFKKGGYKKLLVSGCIVHDEWTSNSTVTYADWGANKLRRLGAPPDILQPIPCMVQKLDRTYSSAEAVKKWLEEHAMSPHELNVVTQGCHARRSWYLFQRAFGPGVKVGVISVPDPQFDPAHWWRTSEGVREVVGEAIAYVYARFIFRPQNPPAQ